jgi:hypothetical protein
MLRSNRPESMAEEIEDLVAGGNCWLSLLVDEVGGHHATWAPYGVLAEGRDFLIGGTIGEYPPNESVTERL